MLLIDEIDSLVGDTLVSVLRQLRAGYDMRPSGFPQSVVLCGVRDVRDYRIQSTVENAVITGGSAFNIKAESLRLGDFSRAEALALLGQHTEATGQEFTFEALDAVWEQTQGQPWLVNALAYEACFRAEEGRGGSRPIGEAAIWAAQEQLIARRETHLDQLADKLRGERVQRVVEPLLSGGEVRSLPSDDLMYARDLGLISADDPLRIANPIYREVIPRELIHTTQATLAQDTAWYVDITGNLDSLSGADVRAACAALRAAETKGFRAAYFFFTPGNAPIRAFCGVFRSQAEISTPTPSAAAAGSQAGGGGAARREKDR